MRSPLLPVSPEAVQQMFAGLAEDNPGLSPLRLAEIVAAYPASAKARGVLAISRDAAFRMPALWVADAHSRHSQTWVYRFDHATPLLKAARVGAAHATELPYVFGNFGTLNPDPTFWLGGRRGAIEVSGRIQRRWLAFARHGVPAALDGSKHWAPYSEENRSTLLIDGHDSLVVDRTVRCGWRGATRRWGSASRLRRLEAIPTAHLVHRSARRGLKSVPSVYATGKSPTCV